MLKKTLSLVLASAFFLAVAGCNTIHGMGQDIEIAGEGIQEATSE